MVLPRLSNTAGDLILTGELLYFFFDWLRQRPKGGSRTYTSAFYLYALNLLLAAGFTASGAALHIVDPLPQRPTALWVFFVVGCVSTPVIFPVVCTCALYPQMSRATAALCSAWLLVSAAAHSLLLLLGSDLANILTLPAVTFWGRSLDGRSIGGEADGLAFDLLTSIPCARGDGLFIHAGIFTVAALVTLLVCISSVASLGPTGRPGMELRQVHKLTAAMALMLLGQMTMVPLLLIMGVSRTFDAWHVSIFVVMAMAYASLRRLVCVQALDAKVSED